MTELNAYNVTLNDGTIHSVTAHDHPEALLVARDKYGDDIAIKTGGRGEGVGHSGNPRIEMDYEEWLTRHSR